jgi:hypothetical protein
VERSVQPARASSPDASARTSKYSRPKELAGWTWKIDLEGSRVYATVNQDGERIRELFISNGPLSPSVGLLASRMLQRGFDALEVAELLDKVIGTHAILVEGRVCTSPEQAVGEYLREAARRLRILGAASRDVAPS